MDSKLATYQDQQDSDYATYLNGEYTPTPNDQRLYLVTEIRKIEAHLANDECDEYVTPREWNGRLIECRLRLRRLLQNEQETLQKTIHLHCEGLIRCNTRLIDLEAEMLAIEAEKAVSHVA